MVSGIRKVTQRVPWQHPFAIILAGILCVTAMLTCAHAQVSPTPLSKDDVIVLLKGDVSQKRVAELARKKGIDFVVTPEIEHQLRKLGATDSLLAKLKESAPKPTTLATVPVAPTQMQIVEKVVRNIDQYKVSNRTEIRFRPGETVLSKDARDAIDQMATGVEGQRGYVFEIQGFSAGKGQAATADSQKMVELVMRYLVLTHQIPVYRIYLVGMSNASSNTDEATTAGRTIRGRVEISLLRNDLEQ